VIRLKQVKVAAAMSILLGDPPHAQVSGFQPECGLQPAGGGDRPYSETSAWQGMQVKEMLARRNPGRPAQLLMSWLPEAFAVGARAGSGLWMRHFGVQ